MNVDYAAGERQAERRACLDFGRINAAALAILPALLARWLPDGRARGHEWVARNQTRSDCLSGSFRVNLRTGRWSHFATGDKGGDVVSLTTYLHGLKQTEAAHNLAAALGLEAGR